MNLKKGLIFYLLISCFSVNAQLQKIYLEGDVGYFIPYNLALKAEALMTLGKEYPNLVNHYNEYKDLTEQQLFLYRQENIRLINVIEENNKIFNKYYKMTTKINKQNTELVAENKSLKQSNRNKWYIIGGIVALYIVHLIVLNA